MEKTSLPIARPAFVIAPNTWGHKKIKLKNKFGFLNDDDLHFIYGQEADMIARLMARLKMSAVDLQVLIASL